MTPTEKLERIVTEGMCTSCGLCQSMAGEQSVRMTVQDDGNYFPVVVGELSDAMVDAIYKVCPGTALHGLPVSEAELSPKLDDIWGPYFSMQKGYAADPAVRHHGSTGGVLTALGLYLAEACDEIDFVLHVKAAGNDMPSFGMRTVSLDRADIMAAAGSRYGPTAALIDFQQQLDKGRPFAFIGKPCDVSAIRGLAKLDPRVDELMKYCLSLVCGGYQPPDSFKAFLAREGLGDRGEIQAVKYRGDGCPGPTVVTFADGSSASMTYTQFWGTDETTWGVPWRCKVCPDGIGDGADIAVADDWPGASPNPDPAVQAKDPGLNACVIRTARGQALWQAAIDAGYLAVGDLLTPRYMDSVQPHQVKKKKFAQSRFQGLADRGRIVPTTQGLRLEQADQQIDARERSHQRQGTAARVDQGKASQPVPKA